MTEESKHRRHVESGEERTGERSSSGLEEAKCKIKEHIETIGKRKEKERSASQGDT